MKPEEFVKAYAEAFGADTQLPIAFGFSDKPLTAPKEGLRCIMGLFPKVRKGEAVTLADKFVIPAVRLGKMLQTMRDTCLFDTPAWGKIRQRIDNENGH